MKMSRFKKLINEHLLNFIEENGFRIHKWDLIRVNKRIIQRINFEPSGWDSDSMTLNIRIKPLFTPPDIVGLGIGGRIGEVLEKWDIWWTLKDEKSTKEAFKEIKDFLINHALPWFAMTRSSEEILNSVKKHPEHPCFNPRLLGGYFEYYLGFIALDARRFDEAREYFQKYLDIAGDDDRDWAIERNNYVRKLLASLDNPEEIREILDENTRKTAEALGIKLEEWEGDK